MRAMPYAAGSRLQMLAGGATLAVLSAAANMASPLYPQFQRAYAMSDLTMTLLYATFAAAAIPTLLFFASAADTVGRRPVLLAGLLLAALGTAVFAAPAAAVPGLFLSRVVQGVALGLGTGAGMALMVEASPQHRPALGATAASVAFAGGTGAGPLMAGVTTDLFSGSTSAPFLLMLGALGAVALLVLAIEETRPVIRQRWRPTWPAVPRHMRPSFRVSAATGFLGWCAIGVFLALLPSVTETVLRAPSPAISGAVVSTVLFVSAVSQLLAPVFEPRAAQSVGLTLLAISLVLLMSSYLPIFDQGRALVVMVVSAVTTGAGHGISYWGANQETDRLTPPAERAGVTAALYLAFYAGAGIPALSVGLLTLSASLTSAVIVVSMALVLCVIAFLPVPGLTQTQVIRPDLRDRRVRAGSGEPARR